MLAKIADKLSEFEPLHVYTARSAESFVHVREITMAWGGLQVALNWCKSECRGEWRWQLVESSSDQLPGRYIFYFDSDQDLVAFVMKWG